MLDLALYNVSPTTGFLPETEPGFDPEANLEWHALALELPKLLHTPAFKRMVEELPEWQFGAEGVAQEIDLRTLSYLGHGYLWGEVTLPTALPRELSRAWVGTAQALGRHPILSYPAYCLFNWQRIDPGQPPVLGNIQIVQNFLGGLDEDWFILIHVDIEYRAAKALTAIPACLAAASTGEVDALSAGLEHVARGLEAMLATLNRMPEACDPYIYYTRVRPYIFGTKNNPDLPNGLVYTGQYGDAPQTFRGETGAQSTIVPTLDGLLGVTHQNDPLKEYLLEMRDYMPLPHRRFLEAVEAQSTVRARVEAHRTDARLVAAYNHCVDTLYRFRARHLEYAASYIHKQAQQANNSNVVGTGGTPFMTYLAKHREETLIAVH
ncbi:MAG: hypothetical protein SFY70_06725 [Bacteroidia bacterium]|nr:hypothetical protein [Bacteroidia bacterium]